LSIPKVWACDVVRKRERDCRLSRVCGDVALGCEAEGKASGLPREGVFLKRRAGVAAGLGAEEFKLSS